MKKIASFCVDHTVLQKGMYVSRIDGDITTYDVRMTKPNGGVYLENKGIHTFEHLFATYVRNTKYSDNIVYVGPMGCRTGFYFLVRDMDNQASLDIFKDTLNFIKDYEGEIPGNSEVECGNYLDHDLAQAKQMASDMAKVLENWTVEKMQY